MANSNNDYNNHMSFDNDRTLGKKLRKEEKKSKRRVDRNILRHIIDVDGKYNDDLLDELEDQDYK